MAENKKNQTPKNWRKPEEKPQRLANRPGPKLPSPALGWVLSEKCRRLLPELHRPIVRRLLSPNLISRSGASPVSHSSRFLPRAVGRRRAQVQRPPSTKPRFLWQTERRRRWVIPLLHQVTVSCLRFPCPPLPSRLAEERDRRYMHT
jgi:hypothetical protein